jgi:hypothetical protein
LLDERLLVQDGLIFLCSLHGCGVRPSVGQRNGRNSAGADAPRSGW